MTAAVPGIEHRSFGVRQSAFVEKFRVRHFGNTVGVLGWVLFIGAMLDIGRRVPGFTSGFSGSHSD